MDYAKIDRLTYEAKRAVSLAQFLDEVWGDLTKDEGTKLLEQIDQLKREGWVWH